MCNGRDELPLIRLFVAGSRSESWSVPRLRGRGEHGRRRVMSLVRPVLLGLNRQASRHRASAVLEYASSCFPCSPRPRKRGTLHPANEFYLHCILHDITCLLANAKVTVLSRTQSQ